MTKQEQARAAVARLTPAQVEVMCLMARGMVMKVVAHTLKLSMTEVNNRRISAYEVLGVSKVAQMAVILTLAGMVTDWEVAA